MTDCFEALGEARRPWLDLDRLKSTFLDRSSEVHPDRFHGLPEAELAAAGNRYSDFNSAYQTLREPRSRLLHLLELETGSRPRDVQRIPPGTMDLFTDVGQTCRDLDGFLARRGAVTSPMLKVKLFQEGLDWVERVQAIQAKVRARASELEAELHAMNSRWEQAPPVGSATRAEALPLTRIEEIYRVLSYVARWTEQIQERLVQLAAP